MASLLALGFALASCASPGAPQAQAPSLAAPAPPFSLLDQEGKTWSSIELKDATLLIDFWATWCQPCIAAIPDLNAFQQRHSGQVKLLAVAMDAKGWEVVRPALRAKGIGYPVALGTPELATAYGVDVLPTSVLLRRGRIVKRLMGRHTLAELEAELAPDLKPKGL